MEIYIKVTAMLRGRRDFESQSSRVQSHPPHFSHRLNNIEMSELVTPINPHNRPTISIAHLHKTKNPANPAKWFTSTRSIVVSTDTHEGSLGPIGHSATKDRPGAEPKEVGWVYF